MTIFYFFVCFVQVVNLELFCWYCKSEQKQFQIPNLCKMCKSTKNFGLIKETMDLFHISLAVMDKRRWEGEKTARYNFVYRANKVSVTFL